MSYPPPPGPDNPYGQQPPQGYGYPQQGGQPGYGYPQQPPPYGQPQQGYPQQSPYGYPQGGYPPGGMPAGTVQANNGYINIPYLGPVQLATMGQRFLARLIDGLISGVIFGIAMAVGLAGALGIAEDADDCGSKTYGTPEYNNCINDATDAGMGAFGAALVMMAAIGVFMLLYEWLMVALVGGTFGKLAMGLRVVRENDGQLPGVGGGFIRYIIPIVGAFLCYIGAVLVYLSPFFDNSGKLQGWHDRAAGTVVVKK
ncbi:RDD family protein [Streptomyces sp. NPDC054784]